MVQFNKAGFLEKKVVEAIAVKKKSVLND